MKKIAVIYYSRTGNTEKMAEITAEAARDEGDVDVKLIKVEDVSAADLPEYDGIIMGTPTYYGTAAWQIKKLIDESVSFHGKLSGKVGGAFASAANIGGGNETAILSVLEAMLIHGMLVQGTPKGDHYGAVSIGKPDKRGETQCRELGRRVAALVKKL
jgi:NAD(P)H dehydrogenase (quinone)